MKRYKAYWLGPLMVTTTTQSQGAPLIDRCITRDIQTGKIARGFAILLSPWRRNKYGESEIQTALVLAWGKTNS